MIDQSAVAVIIGAIITGAVTYWVGRYARQRRESPQEVIFEGYEKLLKSQQAAMAEKDKTIDKLEGALAHVRIELDKAQGIIDQLRQDAEHKIELIKNLQVSLDELKKNNQPEPVNP